MRRRQSIFYWINEFCLGADRSKNSVAIVRFGRVLGEVLCDDLDGLANEFSVDVDRYASECEELAFAKDHFEYFSDFKRAP